MPKLFEAVSEPDIAPQAWLSACKIKQGFHGGQPGWINPAFGIPARTLHLNFVGQSVMIGIT